MLLLTGGRSVVGSLRVSRHKLRRKLDGISVELNELPAFGTEPDHAFVELLTPITIVPAWRC